MQRTLLFLQQGCVFIENLASQRLIAIMGILFVAMTFHLTCHCCITYANASLKRSFMYKIEIFLYYLLVADLIRQFSDTHLMYTSAIIFTVIAIAAATPIVNLRKVFWKEKKRYFHLIVDIIYSLLALATAFVIGVRAVFFLADIGLQLLLDFFF